MFDLSFWEILVIGIIAVIVVGPERLPGMAYTAGKWLTKVKRFVANAKAEVESEFNTAELRKLMSAQEEEMQKLRKLVEDTRHDVEQSQHALTQVAEDAVQSVREAATSPLNEPVNAPVDEPVAAQAKTSPSLDKSPSPSQETVAPAADLPSAKPALETALPSMTAQTIEDEMHALSQSLGETLHRPSFGISSEPTPQPVPNASAPTPKARA